MPHAARRPHSLGAISDRQSRETDGKAGACRGAHYSFGKMYTVLRMEQAVHARGIRASFRATADPFRHDADRLAQALGGL
ncbi:MAG: NAD-dependent epimerase/dehydratase family protein [Notoacmeibacter sp.]|nr:NAD-dependent epimerase/dehydratase family protein [Notoacmeibacter sp.]